MTQLTVESVSRYFKVSKPTVRKHINDGKLSVVTTAAGKRVIEISEAQRVYDLSEEGLGKFSKVAEGMSGTSGRGSEEGGAIIKELRERISGLEGSLEKREEDIIFLKTLVEKRDDLMKKALTDQRSDEEKQAERVDGEKQRMKNIEDRFETQNENHRKEIVMRDKRHAQEMAKVRKWMWEVAESNKPWWTKMGIFRSNRNTEKSAVNKDIKARRSV